MTERRGAYRLGFSSLKEGFPVDLTRVLLGCMFLFKASLSGAQCPTEVDVLQPISCSGSDDGVLSVTLPDGVDGSEVYWLQDGDTLLGAVQSGLGPGSYLVFIPGCGALGVTLNEPFTFFITAEVIQLPTCNAPCSGVIEVTPNFGQGNITYSWSHDAAENGPVGTSVCEQVVLVSAVDENGCSDQDIIMVEIPPVEVLTFPTAPSCFGFSDGEASAVATGGLGGDFTFEWIDAVGNVVGSGPDISNLSAGGYIVTATDTGGCSQSQTVFLDAPVPVDVDMEVQGISCFGAEDGEVSATFGGAANYDWTGPDGFAASGAELDSLMGLSPGIYAVLVTASDGCVGAGSIEVESPDPLVVDVFLDPPGCPGLSDGVVGTVAFGGTPQYTTIWTLADGEEVETTFLSNVTAGVYSFVTVDANGCSAEGLAELDDPLPVSVSILSEDPLCAQGPLSETGGFEAIPSGGLAPYNAAWVDAVTGEVVAVGLQAEGLSSGLYGLGLLDTQGCLLDTLISITSPDSLFVDVNVIPPVCFGLSNGALEGWAEGGTPDYTYLWTGDVTPTLSPSLTGLPPGSYALEVTDSQGCQVIAEVQLEEPEPLSLALEMQPVGCAGDDGSASATASGGVEPYSYEWTDTEGALLSEGDTATGLPAGFVFLTLTDGSGCSADGSVEVSALAPLVLDAEVVVDCNDGTASLAATGSGGEGPLTLELTGPDGEFPFDEGATLAPGSYTLELTDQSGCFIAEEITVHPPLQVMTDVVPFGCSGDGSIGLVATGGTPGDGLQFSAPALGPPSFFDDTTAMWEGVEAGTFNLIVDDGTCTVETAVEMVGVSLFDWTVEVDDFACPEASGVINISVVGGLEPLNVQGESSDGSISWGALEQSGLAPGMYSVLIEDAAGCTRDTTVEVTALPALELEAVVQDVSCSGANDGAVVISASGGAAPLSLGAVGAQGTLSPPVVDIPAGTYVVGAMDARGCIVDTTVVVAEPEALDTVVETLPESCTGTADGVAEVLVSGGTGTIEFQWDGGPSTAIWIGLEAGSYGWSATDENGCGITGVAEVESGGGLEAEAAVLTTECEGGVALGTVVITVSGNAAEAVVLLGGLPADMTDISDTVGFWTWTSLAAGPYGWTAELGEGCEAGGQVQVDLPEPLSFSAAIESPNCAGTTGSISINPTGGVEPLTSGWTGLTFNGDTLQGEGLEVNELPEGTYVWSLVDESGCTQDTTISIVAFSDGPGLMQEVTQPLCGGALVGSALLAPFGGVPPYDVIVQGAADTTDLPFLIPGSYPLTVTDAAGCTFADTVVIMPASDFTLLAEVDSATCANAEDGTISLSTENASGSVDFSFTGPFGATPTAEVISGLGAGVYEVTAIDSLGCPAVLLVEVGAPPAVMVMLDSLVRPSCSGDLDGALVVSASGGSGDPSNWAFDWTLDGMELGVGPEWQGLGEGVYAVTVTDAEGCTGGIASIPLVAEGDVQLSTPLDTALCAGQPLSLEATSEGATEATWALSSGEGGVGLAASTHAVAEGASQWVYTASRLGCVRSDTVEVIGWPLPQPDAGQDMVIAEGATASIGTPGNAESGSYAWYPGDGVAFPNQAATTTLALESSTFFILEATTPEGCTGLDTVFVEVLGNLEIPSGFTPNGDGMNDRWNLAGVDQYPSMEIMVFNRWGNVLFTRDGTAPPWDGTLDGIPVPVGTYYYHIRVNEPALQAEWTGPITIMR